MCLPVQALENGGPSCATTTSEWAACRERRTQRGGRGEDDGDCIAARRTSSLQHLGLFALVSHSCCLRKDRSPCCAGLFTLAPTRLIPATHSLCASQQGRRAVRTGLLRETLPTGMS